MNTSIPLKHSSLILFSLTIIFGSLVGCGGSSKDSSQVPPDETIQTDTSDQVDTADQTNTAGQTDTTDQTNTTDQADTIIQTHAIVKHCNNLEIPLEGRRILLHDGQTGELQEEAFTDSSGRATFNMQLDSPVISLMDSGYYSEIMSTNILVDHTAYFCSYIATSDNENEDFSISIELQNLPEETDIIKVGWRRFKRDEDFSGSTLEINYRDVRVDENAPSVLVKSLSSENQLLAYDFIKPNLDVEINENTIWVANMKTDINSSAIHLSATGFDGGPEDLLNVGFQIESSQSFASTYNEIGFFFEWIDNSQMSFPFNEEAMLDIPVTFYDSGKISYFLASDEFFHLNSEISLIYRYENYSPTEEEANHVVDFENFELNLSAFEFNLQSNRPSINWNGKVTKANEIIIGAGVAGWNFRGKFRAEPSGLLVLPTFDGEYSDSFSVKLRNVEEISDDQIEYFNTDDILEYFNELVIYQTTFYL